MAGLSNVFTNVTGRIDSDKDISKQKRDALVAKAEENLSYDQLHVWNAEINGIIIQLRTNDEHLMDFWIDCFDSSSYSLEIRSKLFKTEFSHYTYVEPLFFSID